MAKALDKLLKQKKWTGEEAGQIFLYSTVNDIIHSRKNEKPKAIIEQSDFDKILNYLSYFPKEQAKYRFYLRLNDNINSVEQIFRYYEQEFFRHITISMLILNRIEDCNKLEKKIKEMDISTIYKESLISELLTPYKLVMSDDLLSSKHNRTLLYNGFKQINADMTFFYTMNFVFEQLFEHLEFKELKVLNIDTSLFEKHINTYNAQQESIIAECSPEIKAKFNLYCKKIDVDKIKPWESDIEIVKSALMFTDDKYQCLVENLQELIISLSNTILLRSGVLNG